jgi:hypothetical protein
MANTIAPFGFRPIKRVDGTSYSGAFTTCKMQGNAPALNRGDIVTQLADGTVAVGSAALVTAGRTIKGVSVGCRYVLASLGYAIWSNYWPGAGAMAGTLVDVFVVDDPNVVYEAQASAGPITLADVGTNCDVVIAASDTGFSKWSLGAPVAATATLPWKIYAVGNNAFPISDGYDVTAANNIVQVVPNENWLRQGAGI